MCTSILKLGKLVLIAISTFVESVIDDVECDIVMRHVPGYGVGLYAGKSYKVKDEIEHSVGLYVPKYITLWNELDQYVEAFNSTHHHLMLGHSVLFNHAPKGYEMMTKARPKSNKWRYGSFQSTDTMSVATKPISAGDQIFSFYDEEWFRLRNMTEINPFHSGSRDIVHSADVHRAPGRIPGCGTLLTKIERSRLSKGRAQPSLVAARDIRRGQVIEVVRALLLPEAEHLYRSPISNVIWWRRGYKYTLFE